MPRKPPPTPPSDPLATDDLLGTHEAARLLGCNVKFIYRAIKAGKLVAFIPGGKTEGKRSGQQGYKMKREDLRKWYFGQ